MPMDVDYIAAIDSIKELEKMVLDAPHGARERIADEIIEFTEKLKGNAVEKSISWKLVFNTSAGEKMWGHIDKAHVAAREAGYKFFIWNGWIYTIDGYKTELTENNCY